MSREWGRGCDRRRTRAALVAGLSASVLLVSGCGGDEKSTTAGERTVAAKVAGTIATLVIKPADKAQQVRPDTPVAVTATDGTLSEVTVTDAQGAKLPGATSVDSTTWTASQLLMPNSTYTVTGKLVDREGRVATAKTTFSTLAVAKRQRIKAVNIAPLDGSRVGIAHPVRVAFSEPVKNRAAVEKALEIQSTPAVKGAWYWIDDEAVHYRPAAFWPAGTKVTLKVNLTGVDLGGGAWGAGSRTVSFTVGRAQILRVNIRKLQMKVERSGKVVKTFDVTSGKPGWETRNGIKVIQEKEFGKTWTNTAINAPEHYVLHSDYALRMTESGEFIHDAPWATGNIGRVSGSHGCVGMYPQNARWVFNNTLIGDPVIVTGSPRQYRDLWNLYQDWNVPWSKWSAGNTAKSGYDGA